MTMYVYNVHMKRISLFVSLPQYNALLTLAKMLGLSFSETLRRAIDAYLAQQKVS
jgi:hypothetical protein